MARKKKGGGDNGPNWMDTYGDMVTLLLCFFVLLYSMSSVDQLKWEILVKSFNPNADEVSQIVVDQKHEENSEGEVESDFETRDVPEKDFEELYYTLSEIVSEQSLEDDIEVTQGDGYTFVTFKNNIFFDGNSYVLKDSGKQVLDLFAGPIEEVSGEIKEIQIMGHTSQAEPNLVNDISSDRFLSSNRATVVLIYLQEKNIIEPAKLVSSGFGQFRPISPFDTQENRARNRRVEVLITEDDGIDDTLNQYYNEIGQ